MVPDVGHICVGNRQGDIGFESGQMFLQSMLIFIRRQTIIRKIGISYIGPAAMGSTFLKYPQIRLMLITVGGICVKSRSYWYQAVIIEYF